MGNSRLLSNVARGAIAGIAGTVAMDLVQFIRYRSGGGRSSLLTWEFGGVGGWDDVSAPGQVAEVALAKVTGHQPPDGLAAPAQAITHWSTGTGWGVVLGLASTVRPSLPKFSGPLLGATAWVTSYVVLPRLEIYKPIWKYDAKTLASDLGTHLIFGTATTVVYGLLRR